MILIFLFYYFLKELIIYVRRYVFYNYLLFFIKKNFEFMCFFWLFVYVLYNVFLYVILFLRYMLLSGGRKIMLGLV